MDERIFYITHQGHQIMVIDFSHCTPKQMLEVLESVRSVVAQKPRNSVLALADMTDAHVDREAVTRMKEVLVLDRPYVKRSAWVGSQSLPKVYLDNIRSFSQRQFGLFDTRAEALAWLAQEEP